MTFSVDLMQRDLQAHADLCAELLTLAARENQMLRCAENFTPGLNDYWRKDLLFRLDKTLDSLRTHRIAWQKLPVAERARYPEIARLIRATQDVAMKLIVLDRENEQALLRRGLLPPRHLPTRGPRQHYAASIYQRYGT